jgi:hypothetical protein
MDNKTMLTFAVSKILEGCRRNDSGDRYAWLERITDPELKQRQLEWHCKDQRRNAFFAKVAACVVFSVLIYVVVANFSHYSTGVAITALAWLTRVLWRRIVSVV